MSAPVARLTPMATNAAVTSQEDRVKILLVDDQPDNLLSAEAVLESLGEEIVKARSGREALRHLLDQMSDKPLRPHATPANRPPLGNAGPPFPRAFARTALRFGE